jgi:hypothetical protein
MHGDVIEAFRSIFDGKADFLACNSMPDGQIEPMTHVRFICLRDISMFWTNMNKKYGIQTNAYRRLCSSLARQLFVWSSTIGVLCCGFGGVWWYVPLWIVGGAHWQPWLFVAWHGELLAAVSPIFFSLAIFRCLALSVVYAACSSSAGGFLGGSRLGWEWFACITLCFLFMVRIGDSAFLLAVDCFLWFTYYSVGNAWTSTCTCNNTPNCLISGLYMERHVRLISRLYMRKPCYVLKLFVSYCMIDKILD